MSLNRTLARMNHEMSFFKGGGSTPSAPPPPPPPAPPPTKTSPILGSAEDEEIDSLSKLRGRKSTILTDRLLSEDDGLNKLFGE